MAIVKKLLKALRTLFKLRRSRRRKTRKHSPKRKRLLHQARRRIWRVRKTARHALRRVKRKPRRLKPKKKIAPPRKSIQRKSARPASLGNVTSTAVSRTKARPAIRKPVAVPVEIPVGEITHYFSKIMVCVVKVTHHRLTVGDRIHIKGTQTDFVQPVQSLQIESIDVRVANKGKLVGLKTAQVCREKDKVYVLA